MRDGTRAGRSGCEKRSGGKETTMGIVDTDIQRRDFLRGAALGALGILPLGALGGCSPQQSAAQGSPAEGSQPAQAKKATKGDDEQLTLAEVNELRAELIDSKSDYTCEDGTVIPAVYVKMRTLLDTIGSGIGSDVNDHSFDLVMHLFSEEEAQACLEMPRGVHFTAADFAVESGRDEAVCLELCEDLSSRGLLYRMRRGGVAHFSLIPQFHGIYEYNWTNYTEEWLGKHNAQMGADVKDQFYNSETMFYRTVPVDREIVANEEILRYDDYERIIRSHTVLAVATCQCRLTKQVLNTTSPDCDHPIETCLSTGEEAEFYIENGIGRQINQEEALALIKRSVDAGMVIQCCYSKESEVICSCHGDCCAILGSYVALAPVADQYNVWTNISHYSLKHDKDACIKCGSCAERCPLFAITMDDEGYPTVGMNCVRCGQCGTVCPQGARTLMQKDIESIPELPQTMLDDNNMKTEYRFRNNKIH